MPVNMPLNRPSTAQELDFNAPQYIGNRYKESEWKSTSAPIPQTRQTEYGWDESPAPVYIPEYVTPEDLQYQKKRTLDSFYANFATQFHNRSHDTLQDYQQWVNSLPEATNPYIQGEVTEIAKKYMPKKIRNEYAMQQQSMSSSSALAQQMKEAMDYAQFIDAQQKAGQFPQGYYYDPKAGLKYNPKMLPSLSTPTYGMKNRKDTLKLKLNAAIKEMDSAKALQILSQIDKIDEQIDQTYTMGNIATPEMGGEGSGNPEVDELQAAMQDAQANPDDPMAQAAGMAAQRRLQEMGAM